MRVNDSAMALKPTLPSDWGGIKLRGIAYKGNRLDIAYTATSVTITLLQGVSTSVAAPLQLVDELTGEKQALVAGQAVMLAQLKPFSIMELAKKA